jgi:hypothetical protein
MTTRAVDETDVQAALLTFMELAQRDLGLPG